MEAIQTSAPASAVERPRTLLYTAAAAGLIGAASVALNVADAAGGDVPAMGRALLGLIGVAAAALLWTQPKRGWLACLVWAAIQIPFIAWNVDGSPTAQALYLPLSVTSETTINGEVTSHSEYGINIAGVVLTVMISRWRNDWNYRFR